MRRRQLCFRSTVAKWPSKIYLLNALFCVSLLQSIWVGSVSASEGDEVPLFHACVNRCIHSGCVQASVIKGTCDTACPREHHVIPFWLQLGGWTCNEDCRYSCMMTIEDGRAAGSVSLGSTSASDGHMKYSNGWPFVRVLGLQHIVSAMLSVAAALVHLACLFCVVLPPQQIKAWISRSFGPQLTIGTKRSSLSSTVKTWGLDSYLPISTSGLGQRQDDYAFTWIWVAHALLHLHAAYRSFCYHAKNSWYSELLDNCAMTAVLFFGTLAVAMRAGSVSNLFVVFGAAIVTCQLFFMYVYLMVDGGFSSSSHTQLVFVLMAAQAATWIIWSHSVRHPRSLTLTCYVLLTIGVYLLGRMDDPPLYRLLDVHALCHAFSIPLALMFYSFVAADLQCPAKHRRH